jgi:hypothetical protein
MPRTLALWLILLAASSAGCSIARPLPTTIPEVTDCPKKVAADGIMAPSAPYPAEEPDPSQFWFGTERLWTALPTDGIWSALPRNGAGFTQKLFWWNESSVPSEEPQPELSVPGERLDGDAPSLIASRASNARAGDIGSAMVAGVEFPAAGCWQVTGEYRGTTVSFVMLVSP